MKQETYAILSGSRPGRGRKGLSALIAAAALLATSASASGWHTGRYVAQEPAGSSNNDGRRADVSDREPKRIIGSKISIPDLVVINQEGKKVRLYSDLIKEKLVVLSFFYTNCEGICPSIGYSLSGLQSEISDRLGRDIFFVSISLDPETDSPKALKEWASKWQARRGWEFVTGNKNELDGVIRLFTGGSAGRSAHGAVVFVGDDKRSPGIWLGLEPLIPPKVLAARIEAIRKSDAANLTDNQ
ncbi:MAG TPA: SCO family protein [Blastocatellia bacterium]|nr:SCO family protein [Blastocatellia bacterium]